MGACDNCSYKVQIKNKHFQQYTKYKNYLVKLITTRMSKALQPHASFPIGDNGNNFHSGKFSSIDSIQTGYNQESAMLSGM